MKESVRSLCSFENSKGFTLIEIVVSIIIIVSITTLIFNSYVSFTSRSGLRIRAVEIAEFLRLAQELSASSVPVSASESIAVNQGFQVVRLVVRDGLLKEVRLEEVQGEFSEFAIATTQAPNAFHSAGEADLKGSKRLDLQAQESYFVDFCFIDSGQTRVYTRVPLEIGSSDCSEATPTYALCSEPSDQLSDAALERNEFAIHFSIEQPTREVHTNVFPFQGGAYLYAQAEPNGHQLRVSNRYEGIRVVVLTREGLKSSVDVFTSGFVSTSAADARDGCPAL